MIVETMEKDPKDRVLFLWKTLWKLWDTLVRKSYISQSSVN